jgi:hypothetical protein
MMTGEKSDIYSGLADRYGRLAEKEEKLIFLLSVSRLLLFVTGGGLAWLAFTSGVAAGIILSLVLVFAFLYLVRLYSVHDEKKIFFENLVTINRNELLAAGGDLSPFDGGGDFIVPGHHFSGDLDLFGNGSLFRYLNRTVTDFGRETLAGWLSDPFSLAADLKRRQAAVRELADRSEWRQHFTAAGMRRPLGRKEIGRLSEWLNRDDEASSLPGRLITGYVLPALTLALLALTAAGLVPWAIFSAVFLINLLIVSTRLKHINRVHRSLSGVYGYLSSLHQLLDIFGREEFGSEILQLTKKELSGTGISAVTAVRKLSALLQAFDSRLNILVGFMLNGLLLWDLQMLIRLGKWKVKYGSGFPAWLEMTGRIDAFNSLANYSFNNPGYAWPELSGDGTIFRAADLGHPLIPAGRRIRNDFGISRKGQICIITGANMSGKSTFLRTVAVNHILAMAGAPVCAGSLTFEPVKLFTSMRTADSLAENESYFYAELKRLRQLKEEIEKGGPVLFILDEILKGTNSADKTLGSRLFIKKLAGLGGTGLIATHDTSLGELEEDFKGVVTNKCFEVDIEGETIMFDYKIRTGVTLKMNAAFLMKQMGILD